MKKYRLIGIILFYLFILGACAKEGGEEDFKSRNLENIKVIEIDYGSTAITLESIETDSLEVILRLKGDGPGIQLEEKEERLMVSVGSDIIRLLKLNKMPKLHVKIPSKYEGDIIMKGSSGKVSGENLSLSASRLEVNGSSGGVNLDFQEYHSDLFIHATSGNVDIKVIKANLDVAWFVQSNSGNKIMNGIFVDKEQEGKRETRGVIGTGKYLLEVKTSSGNIKLE